MPETTISRGFPDPVPGCSIQGYGAIAVCRTLAPVLRSGPIDSWCEPDSSSPSCLSTRRGALLLAALATLMLASMLPVGVG